VSTILKALRRLEQERESLKPTGPTPVFSRSAATIGGVAGWFLTPWVRRGMVGFVIIALSVVAFHFYRQSRFHSLKPANRYGAFEKPAPPAKADRHNTRTSASEPVAKKEPVPMRPEISGRRDKPTPEFAPAAVQTNPRAANVNPNHQQPGRPAISKIAELPVQEQPFQTPTPATGAARQPNSASRRPRPAEIPATEVPTPVKDAGQTGAAPEKSMVKASPAGNIKGSSDAFENAPPLTDGRLKVHAIAWSPTVEERMAVVNNRVIYEGDSVDNFVVVAIRPDDVVVREKDKGLWKVVFGRP
jgi:hypothetical protein